MAYPGCGPRTRPVVWAISARCGAARIATVCPPGHGLRTGRSTPVSEPTPVRAWRPPLLTRILAANAVVVLLGAVAGTLVTKSLADESTLGLVLGFAALGVALSLLINYIVLRRTLRPLSELTRAVGRIHDDLSGAPLPVTPGNDPDLDRLTLALNTMLDRLAGPAATSAANRRDM